MGNCGLIAGAFSSDTTISTPVAINKGGTGQTTAQAAIDALTAVSGASTNEVLTKDGSGNASWETAAGGLWTQIGNYRATSEEASTSFTSLAVDLDNDYSKVVLIMTGKSAAAANAGFYLNSVSSGSKYDYTQLLNDSTTVSGSVINENVINILPSGLIDAADNYFSIIFEITFSGDDDEFLYQFSGGAAHEGNIVGAGKGSIGGGDELGQINVSFGGNWRAGTQINVYKVAI